MAGIEKDYYTLEEIEERWGLPRRDLTYLAENGLLKVSIRLYGVWIERGCYEDTGDGQWHSIPMEQTWFQGLQDLRPRDVYKLFHEGVGRFRIYTTGLLARLGKMERSSKLHPDRESSTPMKLPEPWLGSGRHSM